MNNNSAVIKSNTCRSNDKCIDCDDSKYITDNNSNNDVHYSNYSDNIFTSSTPHLLFGGGGGDDEADSADTWWV